MPFVGANYNGVYKTDPAKYPNVTSWTYAPRDAQTMKQLGYNIVRRPVMWNSLEKSTTPAEFVYSSTYLATLASSVKIFTDAGLPVIVSIHLDYSSCSKFLPLVQASDSSARFTDALFTDLGSTSAREHLAQLWLKTSSYLGNNPNVLYDIKNEPGMLTTTYDAQQRQDRYRNDVFQYVLNTLRNAGDNHPVLYEPMRPNELDGFKYMANWTSLIPDANVIYSPHWYRGTAYPTGDCSIKPPNEPYYPTQTACVAAGGVWTPHPAVKMPYWDAGRYVTNNSYTYLNQQFIDNGVEAFMQKFPAAKVLVGEFGAIFHNQFNDAKDVWLQNVIRIFTERNLYGWVFWSWTLAPNGSQIREGTWTQRLRQTSKY